MVGCGGGYVLSRMKVSVVRTSVLDGEREILREFCLSPRGDAVKRFVVFKVQEEVEIEPSHLPLTQSHRGGVARRFVMYKVRDELQIKESHFPLTARNWAYTSGL